jgi:uncharacterized protein
MLRTSSYTIFVSLPDNETETLLVHGYTGAYDKVSKPVANFLKGRAGKAAKPLYGEWVAEAAAAGGSSFPGPDVRDAIPSDATLAELEAQGYLTHLSGPEEEDLFGLLASRLHERALRQPPSYIFMPTYDCNLRCPYCYQDSMRTDCSMKHLLQTLRPPIVDRIFAALPKIESLHGIEPGEPFKRQIGFFGGEPFLAANRPVVEYVLEKAFAAGPTRFWAVTNGTEIDAYLDLLGPDGISQLQITLDGPPAEHDRRRVYADGGGSYARIAANIDRALERGAYVSVRLNVDRRNLADLPAVADEMVARGWDRQPLFSAYTAPIRPGNGKTEADGTLSSWDLDKALSGMRERFPSLQLLARPDEGTRVQARRIFDATEEILPSLKPSFCSAHDRMYIFDPFGDIYACWEKTGDEKVRIGNVTPEGDVTFRIDQQMAWRSRTVASNPVCRRCRYALHCGGGCAVLAQAKNGAFHSNYCDGFAARFRNSVAESYLQHQTGALPSAVGQRVCDL